MISVGLIKASLALLLSVLQFKNVNCCSCVVLCCFVTRLVILFLLHNGRSELLYLGRVKLGNWISQRQRSGRSEGQGTAIDLFLRSLPPNLVTSTVSFTLLFPCVLFLVLRLTRNNKQGKTIVEQSFRFYTNIKIRSSIVSNCLLHSFSLLTLVKQELFFNIILHLLSKLMWYK